MTKFKTSGNYINIFTIGWLIIQPSELSIRPKGIAPSNGLTAENDTIVKMD